MCPGLRADQLAAPGCYASRVTDAQRREDAPRERSEPGQRREPGQQREPRQPGEAGQDGEPGRDSEPGQDSEPGRQARIQHDGIVDLLGMLAYAELDAYFRLTEDAALAPSLPDRAALAGMAVAEFGHFRLLGERLSALGAQPDQAMLPFAPALDAFHARTAPADWLEGLVKAYVGDGIAADFYRAVAELVDPQTRELVLRVLADTGHAEFVIARVRAAIAADPHLEGRLALWARRLVGEALAQAYRVVADRQSLAGLLAGASAAQLDGAADTGAAPPAQLGDIGRMLARITDAHAQRMAALGLAS
jgi:tRNA-(MS[2]IO[6]A)-hydroxylase (MiaE)-like